MRKNINILCAAAAMLALASCAKETVTEAALGETKTPLTFTAGFDAAKTAIGTDLQTTWVTGDKFTVYDSDFSSEEITVPETDNGKTSTTFTTTSLAAGSSAYYAVLAPGTCGAEAGVLKVGLLYDNIDGKWNQVQAAASKAGKDGKFTFANISSVVSFELDSDDVSKVTFSSPTKFCYGAKVTFNDKGNAVVENDSECLTETVVVNTAAGSGKYYFAAFADSLSSMTISLEYASETKTIEISAPFALKQGSIINLGPLEGRVTKAYSRATKEKFTTTEGSLDEGGNFTFKAYKGNASTAPGNYNDGIRLYQGSEDSYGGYLDVVSVNGDKITGVTVTSTFKYASKIAIQDASVEFDPTEAVDIAKSSSYGVGNLDAASVRIYCCGTNSNARLEILKIEVTYLVDNREVQTLSFPQASYSATVGQPFTAPVLSGAQTSPVTYSSSNEEVATVNESTGAVTLVGGGKCTVTASAPESETYKSGFASYELSVAAGVQGIAGIKTLATSSTAAAFVATLQNAVVTAVGTVSGTKQAGFIQDGTDAIYFFLSTPESQLVEGAKISGTVTGKASLYNGVREIAEIDLSKATVETGAALPLQTLTIAQLNASYADYEYCRIKIEGATVTDPMVSGSDAQGTITQGTDAITTYSNKKDITLEKNTNVNVICYPSYFRTASQAVIWNQSDVELASGPNTITMASTRELTVGGESWTIGATCLSGDAVTYEITAGSEHITLENGVVTPVSVGTATITASSPASGVYSAATATCAVTVTQSGASSKKLVFNFSDGTSFPAGFPISSQTKLVAENEITVSFKDSLGTDYSFGLKAPDGYYRINNKVTVDVYSLFFGKSKTTFASTAYVKLPAIEGYKLKKVTVLNSSNAAANVAINIYDAAGGTLSTGVATSKGGAMAFEVDGSVANTSYFVSTLTNGKNMQFQRIELVYAEVK